MKKILLLATTPFMNDGLTKIELDIINYNKNEISFEVASAFDFNNEFGKRLKILCTELHRLPCKRMVYKYIKGIYNLVSDKKYDAVYIHGNSAMMFLEALPSKMAGVNKIITHCHNTKSDFPVFHYLFKPFFNSIVSNKIACSSYAAKWAYSGKNIEIILNGVDLDRFRVNEDIRKEKRSELGWEDAYIVGHVGRFNKQKNHIGLIKIFKKLLEIDDKARLLLIGEGELKNKIHIMVKELGLETKICFLGVTDNVNDYMQAMDVMVLPSRFEGLCVVALEAQANGMPLILSDKFSPETLATKSTLEIPFDALDEIWAKQIEKVRGKEKVDNSIQLKKRHLDFETMMESIRKILIS